MIIRQLNIFTRGIFQRGYLYNRFDKIQDELQRWGYNKESKLIFKWGKNWNIHFTDVCKLINSICDLDVYLIDRNTILIKTYLDVYEYFKMDFTVEEGKYYVVWEEL